MPGDGGWFRGPPPPEPGSQRGSAGKAGPPVVLFPSLAGSVLEAQQSPVDGWADNARVWMSVSGLMSSGESNPFRMVVEDSQLAAHEVSQPFVQHMVLEMPGGGDPPQFRVRAKPGLDGCEYLSDQWFGGGTVVMGVISEMLKANGYSEWNGQSGGIIGASFDWRITPLQLEARDQYFSKLMAQTEAMVAADPERRPAVVLGFSLGCRIAKYFLHYCHATKGEHWMSRHIREFVSLGGPYLGAVSLLQAVMVDGTFPPLDLLFTQSQMLTILRSVPVGRYLQPSFNWDDGMNMPFLFIRDQLYLSLAIGQVVNSAGIVPLFPESTRLQLLHRGRTGLCTQPLSFHASKPFSERVVFALQPDATEAMIQAQLVGPDDVVLAASTIPTNAIRAVLMDSSAAPTVRIDLHVDDQSSHLLDNASDWDRKEKRVGQLVLGVRLTDSRSLSRWGERPDSDEDHPLSQHCGGTKATYNRCTDSCRKTKPASWSPGRPAALQAYERLFEPAAAEWQVPAPGGDTQWDTVPPPVSKVTAIYGVNLRTPRALFLKHRDVFVTGGTVKEVFPRSHGALREVAGAGSHDT